MNATWQPRLEDWGFFSPPGSVGGGADSAERPPAAFQAGVSPASAPDPEPGGAKGCCARGLASRSPLGPLFSSREAPHASGAFNGNPRRPGNPGRDPGPPGTLRICLAFPAPERLRGELEARARDPNPAFPEEPPLVGWLPSVWARAPHAREV